MIAPVITNAVILAGSIPRMNLPDHGWLIIRSINISFGKPKLKNGKLLFYYAGRYLLAGNLLFFLING